MLEKVVLRGKSLLLLEVKWRYPGRVFAIDAMRDLEEAPQLPRVLKALEFDGRIPSRVHGFLLAFFGGTGREV
jgi:hypothetical protein